jgi:hypothetical protein
VLLLEALLEIDSPPGGRILVWGHSHGGNVLALASNLLGGDPDSRERFFHAARSYYRWPLPGRVDVPVWRDVRSALRREDGPLSRFVLDVVTFGTPVRYGWESNGYDHLLHVVHHRPVPGIPEHRAPFPPPLDAVRSGVGGDFVQSTGIAGTNLPPPLLAWRSWLADRRLHRLLQKGVRSRELLEHLKLGPRVPQEGTTLLVDYDESEGRVIDHAAGHAVYTRPRWLLFHSEEVAKRFYGLDTGAGR